jgi:F420-dependent oxidoreductase-like protein
MRVCLMIEGQENVTWEQWVALARSAERNGFETMFRSDHYSSLGGRNIEGSLDAWTTIAGLSALTDRIKFGTLVSPITFRPPAILAKSVITADHISGGRIELGMGAGWHEGEHGQWGFDFPPVAERVTRLEEQAEIVHRLMSKDERSLTFEGKYYRLEDCPALPKPVQDPHPRLLIGGQGGPRVARIAATWADEYNTFSTTPDRSQEVRAALDAACDAIGRDPATLPLSIMTSFATGASREEAAARAARLLERRGQPAGEDPLAALAEGSLAGTPGQVLQRLAQFAAVGVTRVMLQHLLHDDLEVLDVIGSEIIPEAAKL